MNRILSLALLMAVAATAMGQTNPGGNVPYNPPPPGNKGGGAPTGAASNCLNGTYPGPGLSATCVVAGVAGQAIAPSSVTGDGSGLSNLNAPQSFGSSANQFVQQQVNNSNYTTLEVNSLNDNVWVEGFAGGPYTGVGQAQVAWVTATNYNLCQNVSRSGGNYIAVTYPNSSVDPATNAAIWWPKSTSDATTQADCAFATAAAQAQNQNKQTVLHAGSGNWNMTGWIEPTGLYAVNVLGCGIFCTTWNFTGTAAVPMLYRATGGSNFAFMRVEDAEWQGNNVASAILDLNKFNQSELHNLQLQSPAPGSSYIMRTGTTGGDGFQLDMSGVTMNAGSTTGSTVNATANVVGGSVTSYTINNGGTGYPAPSSTSLYFVSLSGTRGDSAATPCAVMPIGQVVTRSGNAISAISEGSNSGGSGCSGTIDVQVYTYAPITYGWLNHASDCHVSDVTIYAGSPDGYGLWNDGGNCSFYKIHPSFIPNGIYSETNSDHWSATELDNIFNIGMYHDGVFSHVASSVSGTQAYGDYPRTVYFMNTGSNVNIGPSATLCGGTIPTDWHVYMTPTGPIDTISQWPKFPGGSAIGGDTSCGETMGDYIPTLTSISINSANLSGASIVNSGVPQGNNFNFQGPGDLYQLGAATWNNADGMHFYNQGTNTNDLQLVNGVGEEIPSGFCYTFSSSSIGQAGSDSFLCRSAAGAFTLGSTQGGTNGALSMGVLAVSGSQSLTSVQGTAGTKLSADSGAFTNGNLRSTNSTGDEVDSGVAATTVARVSNAITSATAGSGISAVTCTTAACTNLRGTYTMTATTVSAGATILTLVWPTTTTAYVCLVSQDGGTLAIAPSHSVATATGMAIVSDLAITSGSIGVDYSCQP